MPAASPLTHSNAPCPSGKKSISRTARCGQTANFLPCLRKPQRGNLHLSHYMVRHPTNAIPLLFLVGFFLSGNAASQEKPDRPPWAQPAQPPRPAATSTNTPPPTPVNPGDYSPDPIPATSQERGKIKVNVNLVSVLVSVLDDKNRP